MSSVIAATTPSRNCGVSRGCSRTSIICRAYSRTVICAATMPPGLPSTEHELLDVPIAAIEASDRLGYLRDVDAATRIHRDPVGCRKSAGARLIDDARSETSRCGL